MPLRKEELMADCEDPAKMAVDNNHFYFLTSGPLVFQRLSSFLAIYGIFRVVPFGQVAIFGEVLRYRPGFERLTRFFGADPVNSGGSAM